MITVKDFQGLTDAYVVRHCRKDEPTITKCPIISVGRTYVTVQIDGWCEYKFRNLRGNDAFLTKLDGLLQAQTALKANGHIKLQLVAHLV